MSSPTNLSRSSSGQAEGPHQDEGGARSVRPEVAEGAYKNLSFDTDNTESAEPGPGRHGRGAMRRFLYIFDLGLIWCSAVGTVTLSADLIPTTIQSQEPVFRPGSAGFLLL